MAQNGSLKIVFQDLQNSGGRIAVAIYDTPEKFLKEDFRNLYVPIQNQTEVEITLEDLPDGKYALSMFHDLNSNDTLDTNFIGLPKEPYAFGNNAMGTFGPPSFEDASILIEEGKTVEVSIIFR